MDALRVLCVCVFTYCMAFKVLNIFQQVRYMNYNMLCNDPGESGKQICSSRLIVRGGLQ